MNPIKIKPKKAKPTVTFKTSSVRNPSSKNLPASEKQKSSMVFKVKQPSRLRQSSKGDQRSELPLNKTSNKIHYETKPIDKLTSVNKRAKRQILGEEANIIADYLQFRINTPALAKPTESSNQSRVRLKDIEMLRKKTNLVPTQRMFSTKLDVRKFARKEEKQEGLVRNRSESKGEGFKRQKTNLNKANTKLIEPPPDLPRSKTIEAKQTVISENLKRRRNQQALEVNLSSDEDSNRGSVRVILDANNRGIMSRTKPKTLSLVKGKFVQSGDKIDLMERSNENKQMSNSAIENLDTRNNKSKSNLKVPNLKLNKQKSLHVKSPSNTPLLSSDPREEKFSRKNSIEQSLLDRDLSQFRKTKTIEATRRLRIISKVYDSFSEDEDPRLAERPHLKPNSPIFYVLDSLMIATVFYSLTYTPILLAFDSKIRLADVVLDVTTDLVLMLSCVLNFFKSFRDFEENNVTDHWLIALNYLNRWFFLDVIASIPFNSYYSILLYRRPGLSTYDDAIPLSPILRLTRLVKVYEVFDNRDHFFHKALNCLDVLSLKISRLLNFVLFFLFYNHVFACIWIYIVKSIPDIDWIEDARIKDSPDVDFYITSMYSNLTFIFSIGFGKYTTMTPGERMFNISVMLLGMMVNSFSISSLSSIFQKQESRVLRMRDNMDNLESLNQQYSLDQDIMHKVLKYINYAFETDRQDQMAVITELPYSLKTEFLKCMYRDEICRFKFLRKISHNMEYVIELITCLKPSKHDKGELLIKQGEHVKELILIKKGTAILNSIVDMQEVHRQSIDGSEEFKGKLPKVVEKINVMSLRRNEYFGDALMMANLVSPVNLKVKSRVIEIYILSMLDLVRISAGHRKDLASVLETSMKNLSRIKRIINSKLGELHEKYTSNLSCFDSISPAMTQMSLNPGKSFMEDFDDVSVKSDLDNKRANLQYINEEIKEVSSCEESDKMHASKKQTKASFLPYKPGHKDSSRQSFSCMSESKQNTNLVFLQRTPNDESDSEISELLDNNLKSRKDLLIYLNLRQIADQTSKSLPKKMRDNIGNPLLDSRKALSKVQQIKAKLESRHGIRSHKDIVKINILRQESKGAVKPMRNNFFKSGSHRTLMEAANRRSDDTLLMIENTVRIDCSGNGITVACNQVDSKRRVKFETTKEHLRLTEKKTNLNRSLIQTDRLTPLVFDDRPRRVSKLLNSPIKIPNKLNLFNEVKRTMQNNTLSDPNSFFQNLFDDAIRSHINVISSSNAKNN